MTATTKETGSRLLTGLVFNELEIGQSITVTRTIAQTDIQLFAAVSGDFNPVHLDPEFASSTAFGEPIAHGMLCGALVSSAIAMELPGPGSVYRSQSIKFSRPVMVYDTLTITITVEEKNERSKLVKLRCNIENQHHKVVASGIAEVIPPKEKLTIESGTVPRVVLDDVEYSHE